MTFQWGAVGRLIEGLEPDLASEHGLGPLASSMLRHAGKPVPNSLLREYRAAATANLLAPTLLLPTATPTVPVASATSTCSPGMPTGRRQPCSPRASSSTNANGRHKATTTAADPISICIHSSGPASPSGSRCTAA